MISVVIPTLNESDHITAVVRFVASRTCVNEVIVVDDGSTDGTRELARAAGAKVLTSTLLGKGASMRDGLRASRNDILVFLDGDLDGLHSDALDRVTQPLLADEADLVISGVKRPDCHVSILTAKSLLQLFFPEFVCLNQTMGGILAARRSLLDQLRFESDFGVDIGLLLDASHLGARISEVDLGSVDHGGKSAGKSSDMAMQVARAIVDRAARFDRLHASQIAEGREAIRHSQTDVNSLVRRISPVKRVALFAMDRVLVDGEFVVELAQQCDKSDALRRCLSDNVKHSETWVRSIASLFKDVPRESFEYVASELPLTEGSTETIVALRTLGYRVGIVTNSFLTAAETIQRRVFADFSVAHAMKFQAGRATGEVVLAPAMSHPKGCARHRFCKVNVMSHLIDHLRLTPSQVMFVGDSEDDICLLQSAGTSFAFRPLKAHVAAASKHILLAPLPTIVDNAVIMAANK